MQPLPDLDDLRIEAHTFGHEFGGVHDSTTIGAPGLIPAHGDGVQCPPHYDWGEPGAYRPSSFADPRNTSHEKAMLCRAAENTCWFASVNMATAGSLTTSAVVRPDGVVLAYQPYGEAGLLVADDIDAATGLLAARCKTDEYA